MWHSNQNPINLNVMGSDGDNMRKQEFTYGSFNWLHYPEDVTDNAILVARVTIYPGQRWPEHIHGGYEQMLYVISGRGEHWVNGQKEKLEAGKAYFLPVNASHTMINTEEEPLIHLSVYHPKMPEAVREITRSMERQMGADKLGFLGLDELTDVKTMQTIQDKFAAAVGLGVVTVKDDGEAFTKPTELPQFCRYVRRKCEYASDCRAFDPDTGLAAFEAGSPLLFDCCMGIVCVAVPLLAGSELVGHMACGFVKLSEPNERRMNRLVELSGQMKLNPDKLIKLYEQIEIVLQAQMMAAADSLSSIANSMLSLSLKEMKRSLETRHASEMLQKLQQVNQLKEDLQKAELRATEARMKPHFLFNALNTIAATIGEGGKKAEEIVYSLSDFLRFSLRHKDPTATVSQEMDCLKNYLKIQNARFGDDLRFEIIVAPEAENLIVPAMIMQPLVENAIIHGLAPGGYQGTIAVGARVRDDRLIVTVADSGEGFDEDLISGYLSEVEDLKIHSGIGMHYVGLKLRQVFENDYEFIVRSKKGCGTAIVIDIPARRAKENDRSSAVSADC